MKRTILFTAIASILSINSVFAEPQTITTQTYVDNAVATKQDKIAGHSTGRWYPSSVITDTASDGVIQKRVFLSTGTNGISGGADTWGPYLANGDLIEEGGALMNFLEQRGFTINDVKQGVISAGIIDYAFGKVTENIRHRQKEKVCVQYIEGAEETSENCLLWNLPD